MTDFPRIATRAEVLAALGRRRLDEGIRAGTVIRARGGRYLPGDAPDDVVQAVRVGGRLTCLSLLVLMEVFVFANDRLHVHMTRGSARMRDAAAPGRALAPRWRRHPALHWHPPVRPRGPGHAVAHVVDALVHAVRCQPARHAVATLDSALNKRLISARDLAAVFAALPARFGVLRALVDGRAQSGPETLVRLMLRSLGHRPELQVEFADVGFVDLVVGGWLVIECDSRQFHSSWEQQAKDRERDLILAQRGYVTLRFTATQIMYRPDEVRAALGAVLTAHARCRPGR